MTPRSAVTPQLSDEQLGELLDLLEGADSVELKLTVPASDQQSAVGALQVDPLDAQVRQVFFFDTPELTLYDAGIVVRARRVQRKGDDSVVKLRPVVPDDVPAKLRRSDDFGIEVDAMPGGFVCSGSMKHALEKPIVRAAVRGEQRVRKLFSKEQRRLYEERAPDGIDLDELAILGPLFVLKVKFKPEGFSQQMVGEMWLYPDGSRILELSTKCKPKGAFDLIAESRAFLTKRGVDLSGAQQTKTRKALNFFSKQLQAAA